MRTLKMHDAAALLNVSPSTLRNWERRFGYPVPMRTPGGHRHYAHAEIAALRDALEEGLSISSAVGRVREALTGTGPEGLTRALLDLDFDAADAAMEGALALRALEPAVQDVLLASLEEVSARVGVDSAQSALAAGWATGWLGRARRLCPPPWGAGTILIGDASGDRRPDAAPVRALELFALRAGANTTTLPVSALEGAGAVALRVAPDVVAIAGATAEDDQVGRWTYAVQRALGHRPVAVYRRHVSAAVAPGGPTVLADEPLEASRQLMDLLAARRGRVRAMGTGT